jgi:hypothetical protein
MISPFNFGHKKRHRVYSFSMPTKFLFFANTGVQLRQVSQNSHFASIKMWYFFSPFEMRKPQENPGV